MPRKKKPVAKKSFAITINADFTAANREKAIQLAIDAARKLPKEFFEAGLNLDVWAEFGEVPLYETTMV